MRQPTQRASYSYPEYHDNISEELPLISWHKFVNGNGYTYEYDTNITGSFKCMNGRCNKKGWSSKRIAITIRLYPNHKYNAVVYNQRCKACNSLGSMTIDVDTYAERVVYRLKKWLGFQVEVLQYSGKSKGPHLADLCEGCKAGHCSQSNMTGS